MDNKNVVFNHTLEQYNKKYKNRNYRLVKFTKKEVEDFDKKHNTKNYLLKDRKWWLIKDAYYEIPKAPRYTWFRNLNGAVQAGVCLLGAGVIATAVTVPLVILNQNKTVEPSVTIQGADFDKKASHIELNKDSYIVLKEKSGKTISDVEEVKVGGKVITRDIEWTFNKEYKKVNIKAEAMTSTKIEIKVKTEEPSHIVDFDTWKAKANELNSTFLNSTSEYTLGQITKYVYEGEVKELTSVEYNGSSEDRTFSVNHEDKNTTIVDNSYSGDELLEDGYVTRESICEIYDDEIVYKNENASADVYKELHINKFGYPTYELYGDGTLYEIIFNDEPSIYYNIDWATTSFELVSEQSKTLYEYAQEATKIEFVYRDDTSGVCVGENIGEGQEPVYASFKTEDEEKTLSVWSAGKIRFEDDDRFGRDLEQEEQGRGFFCSCEYCVSITLDNIDTSKVTDFNGTFFGCEGLTSLDVSNFDTFNATDMSTMFEFGRIYSTINTINGLENFNTEKVTTMEEMFCETTLKTLNLSSFNTKSLENTDSMFSVSIDLEKIYVSDKFVVNNVTTSTDMFEDCNELVGGKGTAYKDSNPKDKTYAHIDGGATNPGYFTEAE